MKLILVTGLKCGPSARVLAKLEGIPHTHIILDNTPEEGLKYGIVATPTIIKTFQSGTEAGRFIGDFPESVLANIIEGVQP